MAPDRQSEPGATVSQLIPGGTGAAIGIEAGDVVVRAGDRSIASSADLIAYASSLVGGAPVALTVRRGGRLVELSGPAAERPRETFPAGRTHYGEVAWRGGALRDILVLPEGVENPPVVFLIQGFSCSSIESVDPAAAYRRLGEVLIGAGIGYYRVEKPGLGDSAGTPHCAAIDYATELDAFRSAYRHLIVGRAVPAERIFMLGHSLGGLQAPMLAAEQPPRGIAVYGTVLRNWADYHLAVDQFQDWLMRGADPAEAMRASEARREIFRRFYLQGETPAAVAAANPVYADGLRNSFAWDGGENIFGRHFSYAQQLAGLPLIEAWRDARTNVLAIYGESDLVALYDEDHRLIADLANFYRPGTGRYVEIPGTGHGMDLIGARGEVRDRFRATGEPPEGDFNPAVARRVAEWVAEAMARPPVAAAGG
jgi:pimeloyl-ACP methyl ester carboxylesterase